jgi:hypothetical protein
MTRYQFCERVLRAVYGDQPNDDSNITVNLVNAWLQDGIGIAAQKNYKENGAIEGIQFVNNSFYTVFRNIPITSYEQFIFQLQLPQIPFGLGKNEGIGTLQFVDTNGNVSDPAIPLSENQVGLYPNMRPIPNKTLYYPEGIFLYAISDLLLDIGYTGKVRMVSGGDSTNINSILNVPDDYIPVCMDYCIKMLRQERAQPRDIANDGEDQP